MLYIKLWVDDVAGLLAGAETEVICRSNSGSGVDGVAGLLDGAETEVICRSLCETGVDTDLTLISNSESWDESWEK